MTSIMSNSHTSSDILPFTPNIDPADVERLRTQIAHTRVPIEDVVLGAGADYGMPTEWATKLYNYWTHEYSFEKALSRISQWPHFITNIEELDIHFIHQKSKRPDAVPLLMIHGWPGSFYEFSGVIDPLTAGAPGQQAFNVIVPSLPGFCFSSAPRWKGWTTKDTARVFNTLMHRLGYSKYCIQAGDWGQFVARELGAQYSESCRLIHLNWCPGALPDGREPDERERKVQARGQSWRTEHVGYAVLMRTRPQTLGWMLQDNPIGLMAFIGEKYEEAASPSISSQPHWFDHILTTVCLYYFTRCIMTSALVYFENPRHDQFAAEVVKEENLIKCPFGYSSMGYDTAPNSERAVERTGDLVWYKERDHAGHFACLEDPSGMVEDIRDIVGKHWS